MACSVLIGTLLMTACGMVAIKPAPRVAPLEEFPVDSIIIKANGRSYPFTVWIADTVDRRTQGLMFVRRLDSNRGMLFLFDRPTRPAMWMKNVAIPLDLLFIAADGRILTVARDVTPDLPGTIQPDDAVTGVIELPAGTATRLHLDRGAQIRHAHFVSSSRETIASPIPFAPLRTARN